MSAPTHDTNRHSRSPLWDVDEVAAFLGRPKGWIYDEVEDGRLPAIRVGRLLRFDPAEIDAWLNDRRTGGARA